MFYLCPMNILFTYCYRDCTNHKTTAEIVFPNPENLTLSEIEYKLRSKLTDQEYFHHTDFMVQPLYGEYPDFDKNPEVHEFGTVDFTDQKPTDKRSISDFITNIK